MPDPNRAVLLMAHGGPETLDDVGPFLNHIMGERTPSPELIEEIKGRYAQIGGRSPLRTITEQQARALEKELASKGRTMPVYIGMRHWHPFIKDTVKKIVSDGVQSLLALSLSPHYSKMSVGAYFAALDTACDQTANAPEIIPIQSYCDHPLLLRAFAERVMELLASFPKERIATLALLFTAHSLPERILQEKDPYPEELLATVRGTLSALQPHFPALRWEFAYQSRGRSQGPWLGPQVEEMLPVLAAQGFRDLLLVPIGFVSDHMEILYDIDILYKGLAKKNGVDLIRIGSLNEHPTFISALAERIIGVLNT